MADFCMKRSLSSHTSEEDPEEQLQAEGGGRREGAAEEEEDYDVVSKPASPVSSTGQQQLMTTAPVTLPESASRRRSRSGVGLLSPSSGSGSGSRKPRGRPPGSKNKPKPPVYITRETEGAMKTQQLEIPAGCDVADMVQKFARKHRVGVHVVNGSGVVCNFSLLQPAISLKGSFNLLSLSGTFIGSSKPVTSSSPSSAASAPWLAVFVGGNSGEVFGGTVVGKVVAASNVVLNVSTFGNYEFHRVDPGEYEDDEEQVVDDNSNRGRLPGKMEGCSVSTGVGFAVPAEHLNWAPPPSAAATRPPPNHRGF